LLCGAIGIALLCHWLAFRLMQVPLPKARTGIFFVPLAWLLIGIGATLPASDRIGAFLRLMSIASLSLCAVYFLGCLRVSHFKEWKFDAEVREIFGVLREMQRRNELHDIEMDWRYSDPLNFYRESSGAREIAEFTWTEPHTEGRSAYV